MTSPGHQSANDKYSMQWLPIRLFLSLKYKHNRMPKVKIQFAHTLVHTEMGIS